MPLKGYKQTKEHKRKAIQAHKGKKRTEEQRKRISESKKGKKLTEETKRKLSEIAKKTGKGKWLKGRIEERSNRWKGEKVNYSGLHKWVSRQLGKPKICEFCSKDNLKGREIHWANISHRYLRDLSDWLRLCARCHKEYDRVNQLVC
jgi:hypothetical protein